jgi:hypothetical protein
MISSETIRTNATNYYACPIAGLQIDYMAIQLGDLILIRLNRSEWEKIERRYIFKDWYSRFYNANPVFVYQSLDEVIDEQTAIALLDNNISRLISSLRLYKHGNILDPIYTARFLVKGNWFDRQVGPFRTEYLAFPVDGLTYEMRNEEKEFVNNIYDVLKTLDITPKTDLIHNLINNFNLSFLPTMKPFFKLSILFTGLEMLYGRIDSGICNNSTMYTRAFAMITAIYGELPEEDGWRIFFTQKILELRNIVHHNTTDDFPDSLDQAIIYLQESIRNGIKMLMRLYLLKTDCRSKSLLSYLDKIVTPKEFLNLSLERFTNGDNALIKMILSN